MQRSTLLSLSTCPRSYLSAVLQSEHMPSPIKKRRIDAVREKDGDDDAKDSVDDLNRTISDLNRTIMDKVFDLEDKNKKIKSMQIIIDNLKDYVRLLENVKKPGEEFKSNSPCNLNSEESDCSSEMEQVDISLVDLDDDCDEESKGNNSVSKSLANIVQHYNDEINLEDVSGFEHLKHYRPLDVLQDFLEFDSKIEKLMETNDFEKKEKMEKLESILKFNEQILTVIHDDLLGFGLNHKHVHWNEVYLRLTGSASPCLEDVSDSFNVLLLKVNIITFKCKKLAGLLKKSERVGLYQSTSYKIHAYVKLLEMCYIHTHRINIMYLEDTGLKKIMETGVMSGHPVCEFQERACNLNIETTHVATPNAFDVVAYTVKLMSMKGLVHDNEHVLKVENGIAEYYTGKKKKGYNERLRQVEDGKFTLTEFVYNEVMSRMGRMNSKVNPEEVVKKFLTKLRNVGITLKRNLTSFSTKNLTFDCLTLSLRLRSQRGYFDRLQKGTVGNAKCHKNKHKKQKTAC